MLRWRQRHFKTLIHLSRQHLSACPPQSRERARIPVRLLRSHTPDGCERIAMPVTVAHTAGREWNRHTLGAPIARSATRRPPRSIKLYLRRQCQCCRLWMLLPSSQCGENLEGGKSRREFPLEGAAADGPANSTTARLQLGSRGSLLRDSRLCSSTASGGLARQRRVAVRRHSETKSVVRQGANL